MIDDSQYKNRNFNAYEQVNTPNRGKIIYEYLTYMNILITCILSNFTVSYFLAKN